jgi:DNA modification methylase
LLTLPSESVQICVTSPPYWGLRDYGTASWEGGDPDCDHTARRSIGSSTLRNDGRRQIGTQAHEKTAATVIPFRGDCLKCGATRIDRQIGLEPTPEEYVENLVDVFREVKRVLRPDGVIFLNLGDSYCSGNRDTYDQVSDNKGKRGTTNLRPPMPSGLKPKDLVGIPWMTALALRQDGWYLRSDIIWAKPNPMPESVTDRCTRSHEYIFLLAKSETYYYNADAIAEPLTRPGEAFRKTPAKFGGADKFTEAQKQSRLHSGNEYKGTPNGTRNKRDVWTIASNPFPDAHFAVFPEDLVRPCILAGCPAGCTVLDPFAGSGTTMLTADKLNCRSVGIELNPDYCKMAIRRLDARTMNLWDGW